MIDLTAARQHVEGLIQQEFSSCPCFFENIEVTGDPSEYIIITDGQVQQSEDIGSDDTAEMSSRTGLVSIIIFTALNSGTQRSREIGNILSELLSGRSFDDGNYRILKPEYSGTGKSSAHYVATLNLPTRAIYFDNNRRRDYGTGTR